MKNNDKYKQMKSSTKKKIPIIEKLKTRQCKLGLKTYVSKSSLIL